MFLSRVTVTTVGLASKAFLRSPLCAVTVNGLDTLCNALDNDKPVITVSNHISTLDDPVTWGVLPARYYLSARTTRWALGASDVIFTNPLFSTFFRLGQTFETFRGKGIYQPAVDAAIQRLDQGHWVHLYGEGKIHQSHTYPRNEHGEAYLPRFKWGVGRMLMESRVQPIVIPMWISGFDRLMPEGRSFPYKYLPRIGAQLSVTFGDPIPADRITQALDIASVPAATDVSPHTDDVEHLSGWLGDAAARQLDEKGVKSDNPRYARIIRSRATELVRQEVEKLGKSVSGPLLDQPGKRLQ